jgi:hypothetical protein
LNAYTKVIAPALTVKLIAPHGAQRYAGSFALLPQILSQPTSGIALLFMKPTKTKREMRDELENQLKEFLQQGGAVKAVAQGVSGRENTGEPLKSIFSGQASEDRTLVPEVVAAIEERRKPASASKAVRRRRPKKKIILDDFGQPLRWEWVEE